jgi:hypothetical protein
MLSRISSEDSFISTGGDMTAHVARRREDREKVGLMSVMPADSTIVAR